MLLTDLCSEGQKLSILDSQSIIELILIMFCEVFFFHVF